MNFLKKTIFLLLLGLPQMGWAQADGAAGPVCWKLLPRAQVDSAGVFLDQIVTASNSTQILPHLRLAGAPQPGQTNSFTRSEVAGIAQACVAGLVMTNWIGPAEVRVSRRVRIFEDSDLIELLTATLQKEYVKDQGELELHLTHPWLKPQVPDEPLTLKVVEMPVLGVSPSFGVTFELWDGRERIGSWQVPVQASVWHDIPVAHSALQRGEPLMNADVTMERADVLVLRDAFPNFPTINDSLELNEGVAAGRPILNRSVRVRPLVLRGQMVEGVFEDGTLGISLLVESLEDGALGQTVRVRNPTTRRELHGKVESEKTIRINL
jgi:flagella basal body P-ring formation protein FlgA